VAVVWTDQDRERDDDRVTRATVALPATGVRPRGTHLRLTVRDKGFGYAMADHHGRPPALTCAAPPAAPYHRTGRTVRGVPGTPAPAALLRGRVTDG
jgi:hypothetical protein